MHQTHCHSLQLPQHGPSKFQRCHSSGHSLQKLSDIPSYSSKYSSIYIYIYIFNCSCIKIYKWSTSSSANKNWQTRRWHLLIQAIGWLNLFILQYHQAMAGQRSNSWNFLAKSWVPSTNHGNACCPWSQCMLASPVRSRYSIFFGRSQFSLNLSVV